MLIIPKKIISGMIVKRTLTWNIKEAKPILQQEGIKNLT